MSCYGNGFFDRHFERKLHQYLDDENYETCANCKCIKDVDIMHEHENKMYCEDCYESIKEDEEYLCE